MPTMAGNGMGNGCSRELNNTQAAGTGASNVTQVLRGRNWTQAWEPGVKPSTLMLHANILTTRLSTHSPPGVLI